MIAKKYPSIIQRKIQVLLMCFERKFTNYFIKTKVLKVLRIEKPTGFAGWLKIRSKTHSKEPRFILKTQKKTLFF